jgi:hypothetical protein
MRAFSGLCFFRASKAVSAPGRPLLEQAFDGPQGMARGHSKAFLMPNLAENQLIPELFHPLPGNQMGETAAEIFSLSTGISGLQAM